MDHMERSGRRVGAVPDLLRLAEHWLGQQRRTVPLVLGGVVMSWRYTWEGSWSRLDDHLRDQSLRYWASDRSLPRWGPDEWLVLVSVS